MIERYRRMRTERFLAPASRSQYAFVGMGQHSLTNLYPALCAAGVSLKYVCVASQRKANLIARRFPMLTATTSMADVLADPDVSGVFVSALPQTHYALASEILRSGKSLFIEKPPCHTLEQFDELIRLQLRCGSPVAMVGLQQRYAPAILTMKRRLKREKLLSYHLHYHTGACPEGDALSFLYVHPLDLVTFIFGPSAIVACQRPSPGTLLLMLCHRHVTGTLELSTDYTWATAQQLLSINAASGVFRLRDTESLTFEPKPSAALGIPWEKVFPRRPVSVSLHQRNSLISTPRENPLFDHGFGGEINAFVSAVERGKGPLMRLSAYRDTFRLLDEIGRIAQ
jgi:virulence factor